MEKSKEISYLEISYQELSPEALQGVIRDYVLQEGTEYGSHEHSLDQKIATVHKQLVSGRAKICFDPESEMCFLVLK